MTQKRKLSITVKKYRNSGMKLKKFLQRISEAAYEWQGESTEAEV